MNFKTLLAVAALTFGLSAQADFVIDLEGQEADGGGPNIFTVSNADTAEATGLSFDFTYDAGVSGQNISWGSELVVQLEHLPTGVFVQIGTQDEGCDAFGLTCDFDLMWDDAPGIFTATGTIDYMGAIADGSGDWEIVIADSFDDNPGVDGVFLAGSNLTVNQAAAAVPVPGTLLLVGIGLAGFGLARRRTA